jgi:condensin complex subunit 2
LPDVEAIEELRITTSLDDFSFLGDGKEGGSYEVPLYANDTHMDNFDDVSHAAMDDSMDVDQDADAPQEEEDFFVGDNAVADDYAGDILLGDPFDDATGGGEPSAGPSHESGREGTVPFDPRRLHSEKELVLAMTGDSENGVMDYFDKTFMRNWAGPEHWKMRKTIRKSEYISLSNLC